MKNWVQFLLVIGLLIGSSAAQASASLNVSRFSIFFPRTEVFSRSHTEMIFIHNMGDQAAKNLAVINNCIGDFDVFSSCGLELGAMQSCSMSATFAPNRVAHSSCSVNISSSNANSASFSMSGESFERPR